MFRIKSLVAATAMLPSLAMAMAIDPALSIFSSVGFDADNTYTDGMGAGEIFQTIGGVESAGTTYDGTNVIGTNPIDGMLTDTGDGTRHTASMSATGFIDGEYLIGIDHSMQISNSSTDTFRLTFGVDFDIFVDADGEDDETSAFAFVDQSLFDWDTDQEYFVSYLLSDTEYGDEDADGVLGSFGARLDESGRITFDVDVLGGATMDLRSELSLRGGNLCDCDSFSAQMNMAWTLDSFENLNVEPPVDVPEPGSLALLLAGLIGLRFARKR